MYLCLYNPSELGLVLSNNDLATSRSIPGALVGPLVKEGAAIRPNANGTIFYAAVNGSLSIGHADKTVPVVSLAPAGFEPVGDDAEVRDNLIVALRDFLEAAKNNAAVAAKGLYQRIGDLGTPYRRRQLTVTARLPIKPSPPASVTVDLSRYGGAPDTPLYDDGQHDDGAAGDGVYGLTFCFQPATFNYSRDDWRPNYPGQIPLGVTAIFADGSRQGAVGVVDVYPRLKNYYFWAYMWDSPAQTFKNIKVEKEGDVTVEPVGNPETFKFKRSICALRIESHRGPWSVLVPVPYMKDNFTSYQALSFWIKAANGQTPKNVYVQLRDVPSLAAPVTTGRVPVSGGMREGGIGADYRRVILPFSQLLGKNNPPLQTQRIGRLIISGDGETPVTLFINDIQILAPGEEPNPSDLPPTP